LSGCTSFVLVRVSSERRTPMVAKLPDSGAICWRYSSRVAGLRNVFVSLSIWNWSKADGILATPSPATSCGCRRSARLAIASWSFPGTGCDLVRMDFAGLDCLQRPRGAVTKTLDGLPSPTLLQLKRLAQELAVVPEVLPRNSRDRRDSDVTPSPSRGSDAPSRGHPRDRAGTRLSGPPLGGLRERPLPPGTPSRRTTRRGPSAACLRQVADKSAIPGPGQTLGNSAGSRRAE
jgi:hypothetical protein